MTQNQICSNVLLVFGITCLALAACSGGNGGGDGASEGGMATGGTAGDSGGINDMKPPVAGDNSGGVSGGSVMSGGKPSGGGGGGTACACPRELTCDEQGTCQELNPCERDAHCLEGRICEDGQCTDGCADDAACMMLTAGKDRCVDGRCSECGDDAHCPGNTTCDAESKTCVEAETCAESADCLTGRTCVEGTCQGDPTCPTTPCLAGRLCQMTSGLCTPNTDGPCETNDDCSAPFVCMGEGARARCGRCMVDTDCGPGNTCEILRTGNRCAEPAICESSDQCACARVCADGRCQAPAICEDDVYDRDGVSNNTKENAVALTFSSHRNLVSCAEDVDWYKVELPAGFDLEVEVRQSAADCANYSIRVEDAEGGFRVESATEAAEEVLKIPAVENRDRTLFIAVSQAGPLVSGSYRLDLKRVEAGANVCSDGAEEAVGGGDDTYETGRLVRNPGDACFAETGRSGVLCAGDDDYLCFWGPEIGQAAIGERIRMRVDIQFGAGLAVIGTVYNSTGQQVPNVQGRWTSQDDSAEISIPASPGRHCLRLSGEPIGGSGDASADSVVYSVEFSSAGMQAENLCQEAQAIVLEEQRTGEFRGAFENGQLARDSVLKSICGGDQATSGEKVFTVDIGNDIELPALLTAVVSRPNGGNTTLQDPVVSIRGSCTQACSELACSVGQVDPNNPLIDQTTPTIARTVVTSAGTYAIIADGIDGGNEPNFKLDVKVEAAPNLNNDTCESAQELVLNDGQTEVEANLHRASDAVRGCAGLGGADAVYEVTFDAPTRVVAQPRSIGEPSFAVSTFLASGCGDVSPLACGAGFETVVTPGTYFLVVEGYGPNARGRIAIDVWTETLPMAGDNETCETAEPIQVGLGGSLRGDTRLANDDYQLFDFNQLTGRNTVGGDLVYSISNPAGGEIFVQATPLAGEGSPIGVAGWDISLFATASCDNPSSVDNRIVGSDGALEETIVFDSGDADPIYIVVDGSNGEAGPFELRWGPVECRNDAQCADGEQCRLYTCRTP